MSRHPFPRRAKPPGVTVPIPEGMDGEISVIAETPLCSSEAKVLQVAHETPHASPRQPDLFLLTCGINHYAANETPLPGANRAGSPAARGDDPVIHDLAFACDDARKVEKLFTAQIPKTYAHVQVSPPLLDAQATTAGVIDAIEKIIRSAQMGDVVVLFFATHGEFLPDTGFLLVTSDSDPHNLPATALSGRRLAELLAGIRGSVVLMLDTCHSGGVLNGGRKPTVVTGKDDLTGLFNQLSSSEQGIVVLSSSAEGEDSIEDQTTKQGVFTEALVEGFAGEAVQDGKITCVSLQDWMSARVPVLAEVVESRSGPDAILCFAKGRAGFHAGPTVTKSHMKKPLFASLLAGIILLSAWAETVSAEERRVGLVLESVGAWIQNGKPLVAESNSAVFADATISLDTTYKTDHPNSGSISILLSNGERIERLAQRPNDLETPIKIPHSLETKSQLARWVDAIEGLFSEDPRKYVVTIVRGVDGKRIQMHEAVLALNAGRIDLTPVLRLVPAGNYLVRLNAALEGPLKDAHLFPFTRSISWSPPSSSAVITIPELETGLWQVSLLNVPDEKPLGADAWILLCSPGELKSLDEDFQALAAIAGPRIENAVPSAGRGLLRAALETLDHRRRVHGNK